MATIDGNNATLTLTPSEVLAPFSAETAVDSLDWFLIQGSDTVQGTTMSTAVRVGADVVKAYLQDGLVSVDNQGRILVGSSTIDIRPQYRERTVNGAKTLQMSYDGTNWSTIYTQNVTTTTIVNNLTTGGTSYALSAEQGKVLKALCDTKPNYEGSDNTNYPEY